ncbi:MAG: divalent-cation tolerance protein CutA [Gammaproteobacteria bacterium]
METEARVVLCTVPTGDIAAQIARELVQRRLAACVNVIPGITSVYRWKGSITTDAEQLLVIKTSSSLMDSLQQAIQELHPYELPEIIAVPIVGGLPAYLAWINECTKP